MPVDNYLVLYLTVPTQNIVAITRLMYVDRDISTQLLQTEVLADLMDKIAEAEDQVNASKVVITDDLLNQIRKNIIYKAAV